MCISQCAHACVCMPACVCVHVWLYVYIGTSKSNSSNGWIEMIDRSMKSRSSQWASHHQQAMGMCAASSMWRRKQATDIQHDSNATTHADMHKMHAPHAPQIQAERRQACMHTCCICGRGVSCSIGKSSLCCHKHSSQKWCAMKYASKLIRCIAIGGIEWESSFWIAWDSDRYDQRFCLCGGLNSEAD